MSSTVIRPQNSPTPEQGARGGLFGMDAETPTAELDAEDACEEELCPEAQAVHTKKAPELPTQAEVAAHDAVHCPCRS